MSEIMETLREPDDLDRRADAARDRVQYAEQQQLEDFGYDPSAEAGNQDNQNILNQLGIDPQTVQQVAQEPTIASEAATALAGGAADAIDSTGRFLDLSGDTLKRGINDILGRDTLDTEDPWSKDYTRGAWWDIPDDAVPENQTGLGKLARGLVEFGFLTAATGTVGGAVGGGLRIGTRLAAASRVAGIGSKGTRFIKFIPKAAAVAGEGGAAELISTSSEEGNLMNLAKEHTPWLAPWIVNALAINPEDNPWLARIKTVTTGAGINLVGWGVFAFAKGKWAAKDARAAGKSVDESNVIGNQKYQEALEQAKREAEVSANQTAANRFIEGNGVSHANNREDYLRSYLDEDEYAALIDPYSTDDVIDDLQNLADQRGLEEGDPFDFATFQSVKQMEAGLSRRKPDPLVNPKKFTDSEKAHIPIEPNAIKKAVKRAITDVKAGGPGRGYTATITESALKRAAKGSPRRTKVIQQQAEELADELFRAPDNKRNLDEILEIVDSHIDAGLSIIEDGGNMAKKFKKLLREDPNNYRVFADDGVEIRTISPAQKAAAQVQMGMLADQISGIAQGAIQIADNVSISRQVEMALDAMKVLLREHKKYSVMWGLDGVAQQVNKLPVSLREATEKRLKEIDDELDEYFEGLDKLRKEDRYQEMGKLMEVHALSNGKVRVIEDINDFLNGKLFGGSVRGAEIKGRTMQQLMSTFYNSILSSVRTPIKAVFSTNLIAAMRPFMAWTGAALRGDKTEMMVAASMIDSLSKGFAEGMDMFRYNWDLGLNRKVQSYDVRYSTAEDLADWEALAPHIEQFGTDAQKRAYNALNNVVKFNTNPWVKYSTNAMGAGDALARTLIGRMEMRQRSIRKAIEDGVDLNNLNKVASATEENFRTQIFKKGRDNKWVVSDEAAKLAGDEAAMTKALEGWTKGFEMIGQYPLLRPFFPFVRTGVNALDLTFQHTPLALTQRKFRDIINGKNLELYGIRPEDALNAKAVVEGRIAIGSAVGTMAFLGALTGNITGDYPYDKERRDLWKANRIPPYSWKIGNAWVSYQQIEPFNTVMSIAANLAQNADVLGEAYLDEMVPKTMFMFSAVFVDKSMLSGVKQLAAVFNPDSADYQLENTVARQLRAFIPFAGLSRDIGGILDSVDREAQTLGEQIIRRDAFLKSTLSPKYDVLSKDRSGKEYTRSGEFEGPAGVLLNPMMRIFNTMSPIALVPAQNDEVRQILLEMRYNLPEVLSSYKGEPLNSWERSRLQYHLSRSNLRKRLDRLILPKNSVVRKGLAEYKKGDGKGKYREARGDNLRHQKFYREVNSIFLSEIKIAMALVRAENPDLQNRINIRRTRKALGQSGRYDRLRLLSEPGAFPHGK